MKFILALVICSQVQQTCLPPYQWPEKFNSHYDCMIFGYEEAVRKAREMGREHVNRDGTIIKFFCVAEEITGKPT